MWTLRRQQKRLWKTICRTEIFIISYWPLTSVCTINWQKMAVSMCGTLKRRDWISVRHSKIGASIYQVAILEEEQPCVGLSPFHWYQALCFFWLKAEGKNQWYSDRKQTTIWGYDKPKSSPYHLTMKSVPFMSYPIKNSTMTNGIVLDSFLRRSSVLYLHGDRLGQYGYRTGTQIRGSHRKALYLSKWQKLRGCLRHPWRPE